MIYAMGLEDAKTRSGDARRDGRDAPPASTSRLDAGALRLVRAAHRRALDPGRLRRHADGDRHHERVGPARASRARSAAAARASSSSRTRPAICRRTCVCARTSRVAAGRPVLFNVVLAVNEHGLGAQDVRRLARELSRARHPDVRPGQLDPRAVPLHVRGLEPLRLEPGLEQGAHRESRREEAEARRSRARARDGGGVRRRACCRRRSSAGRSRATCSRARRTRPSSTATSGRPSARSPSAARRAPGRGGGAALARERSHRRLPHQERDQRQRASTSASCSPRPT